MRLWKKTKTEFDVALETFAPTAVAAVVARELDCATDLCGSREAKVCSYMDRRGHSCRTAACPQHSEVVDGQHLCSLHAATMRAVGAVGGRVRPGAHQMSSLPEVDNPGPSLVSWMARDLHDRIVDLLGRCLRPTEGERLLIDEVVTPVRGIDGSRRWEQAWKIVSHTGMSLKVAVLVEEGSPADVIVRVGNVQVDCGAPPWFGAGRRRSEHLSRDEASAQRRLFYEPIYERIEAAVIAERSAGVRGPY